MEEDRLIRERKGASSPALLKYSKNQHDDPLGL